MRCAQAPRASRSRADTRIDIVCPAVADKRLKHKSKYTLDRGMPGAFEGETITRRRFMTGSAHTAGAVAAGAFALPALGFAVGPIFKSTPHTWQSVGTESMFSEDNYVPVVITLSPNIGEAGKSTQKSIPTRRTTTPPTPRPTSRSRAAARTSAARSAGSTRPSASSAPATAASTTCSAGGWVGLRSARSIASTRA